MMNINKFDIKKIALKIVLVFGIVLGFSGCSTMMEGVQSQMEVPTLEKQANRVAIGMAIVRENNIMAFKMPISSDALWPSMVSADINESEDRFIVYSLMDDPYYATVHYSELIQRKMLGSSASMDLLGDYGNFTAMILNQTVKPIAKRSVQKLIVFYGRDKKNWPSIFSFDSSLDNFLDFKDGKIREVEAISGDVYETIGDAVISLAPINLQKDLEFARAEMLDAYDEVLALKSEQGELESSLKSNNNLSTKEKFEIKKELSTINSRVSEAELVADEKEKIYFTFLDQATIALESDISLDEDYVKLAKNVNIVANEVQVGATQAYASFLLASANIASNNILQNFPEELKSLAIAKANVPASLQSKYDERLIRLAKNSLYLLPNIVIGTYYANKQANLAQEYEDFTNIILLAHKAKLEQDEVKKGK